MLTNRTLTRINGRPRTVNRLPLLLVGGGALVLAALAALAYAWGSKRDGGLRQENLQVLDYLEKLLRIVSRSENWGLNLSVSTE